MKTLNLNLADLCLADESNYKSLAYFKALMVYVLISEGHECGIIRERPRPLIVKKTNFPGEKGMAMIGHLSTKI